MGTALTPDRNMQELVLCLDAPNGELFSPIHRVLGGKKQSIDEFILWSLSAHLSTSRQNVTPNCQYA